jgi:hypothetical protein
MPFEEREKKFSRKKKLAPKLNPHLQLIISDSCLNANFIATKNVPGRNSSDSESALKICPIKIPDGEKEK